MITNFHAFKLRETVVGGQDDQEHLLKHDDGSESVHRDARPDGAARVPRTGQQEEHHRHQRRGAPLLPAQARRRGREATGEERKEAEKRDEEARVWITGLEAVKARSACKAVYDLSATPFFLRGSGYREGTLFPWVVSDFSLIDAIESGIVKVPRVPVADDSMTGEQPTYRDLWPRIRDKLPKKRPTKDDDSDGEPEASRSSWRARCTACTATTSKYYKQWEAKPSNGRADMTPPVFIVVCNNTNVSKLVYD